MQNIDLINLMSSILTNSATTTASANTNNTSTPTPSIPNELKSMYPYGDFPIKYTKSYQDYLKSNINKTIFSDIPISDNQANDNSSIPQEKENGIDIKSILPIIQTLSSNKSPDTKSLLNVLAPILFKDNPNILSLISNMPLPTKNNNSPINTLHLNREDLDKYTLIT